MAGTTEVLEIQVKYTDGGASNKLEKIASSVERINTAVDGAGLQRLTKIGDNLKVLGEQAANIKKIGPAFTEVANSANRILSTFKGFRVQNYSAGIRDMSKALDQAGAAFNAFNHQASGITRVQRALDKLPGTIKTLGKDDFSQQIERTATTLNGLADASAKVSKNGTGLMNFAYGMQLLPSALGAFDKASTKAMTGGIFGSGTVGNVGKVLQSLNSSMKGIDSKMFSSVGRLADGLKTLRNLAKDENLASYLQTTAQQIVAFATAVSSNISDDVLNRFERLGSAMAGFSGKKSFNVGNLAGNTKAASAAFAGLASKMKVVIGLATKISKLPFKMLLYPIQGIGKGLEEMTKKFTKFFKRVGTVALYRAVRAGIKMVTTAVQEGVNNLYLWSETVGNSFEQTMDSFATSFMYLKNSIGAMVSPLLDVLAPAFEVIVEQAVGFANIINQVIATLTGADTWRHAIRSAADYSDNISGLGHDAEDATDAVKELKRTVLGFDEINKIEDKTKTTQKAKNGKDATGYYAKTGALSFEELPISQNALDIANMLKKAWERADFTQIGNMIGEKIGNALLSVPWEKKIQPAVIKVAKSFGTLLNGMFDYTGSGGKAMWDGIAYTIYNALNTALIGYITFFNTVNWDGIGQGIGAALKQVVYGIKWDWVAQALAAFPNAVIDALTGFSKQFTIKDFYALGQNIGKTVSSALIQINWTGLFGNAVTLATGVLTAINGALEGFDWAGVKDAILTGIKKIPAAQWKVLGTEIGLLAFNVVDFVANLVDTLISAIKKGKWDEFLDGIKDGLNKGAEKYGGWPGVGKEIASWIGKNLDIISIGLSLLIGTTLIKTGAKALLGTILGSSIVGGAAVGGGATLSKFLGSLPVMASLALTLGTIGHIALNGGKVEFMDTIGAGIAGALIGFKYGGIQGALIGFTIGAAVTLAVKAFTTDWSKVAGIGGNFNFSKGDGTKGSFASGALGGDNPWKMYENGGKSSSAPTLKIKADVDTSNSKEWWDKVSKAWNDIKSGKAVNEFVTKGLLNESSTWWQNLRNWWNIKTLNGRVVGFKTEGLTNESGTWKNQLNTGWNSVIANAVSKFKTAGVATQPRLWKSQVNEAWNTVKETPLKSTVEIANPKSAFSTAFNAMQGYFRQYHLKALVDVTGVAAKVLGTSGASGSGAHKKAEGGIYKNGQWHSISQYAYGGIPDSGQMFIAREAGPELVGSIGNSTAVINNDQIVASVSAGVYQAVAAALASGEGSQAINVYIGNEQLGQYITRQNRRATLMSGGR